MQTPTVFKLQSLEECESLGACVPVCQRSVHRDVWAHELLKVNDWISTCGVQVLRFKGKKKYRNALQK